MEGDLFLKAAQYTIDTCSLIDIFGKEKLVSREYMPGLWERIQVLIADGIIISHAEVLREIKKEGSKGEELYEWAHANETVFRDYEWTAEGTVIRSMSPKYAAFVNAKTNDIHADPWLVAQAKCRRVTIITEEKLSGSADPKKHKLPNVCADSQFAVGCVDLLGLIREQQWKF
jgi:hypothetical protein